MEKITPLNLNFDELSEIAKNPYIKGFEADKPELISKQVVEALCRGDEAAFQKVYVHTYDGLKRLLKLLLRNEHDAEEATQDVFLYILENTHRIDPSKNFKGYMYAIARNIANKQFLRRKYDERYTNYRFHLEQDFAISPDELVMKDELALLISIYIENMPPQRRRVFEMNRIEGKSIQEIAEIMGLSTQTVKNYLQTAVNGLRELTLLFTFFFLS